jgi:Uma2 family endonuclease
MITRDPHFPYTFNDYLLLPEGMPVQLIGGELVQEPAPTPYHQRISGTLLFELMRHVREQNLGVVYAAPIDVYFDIFDAFQPDIIFISSARSDIIGKRYIEEAPDMVMEILSPSSMRKDITHKYAVYERSGVREYWIVDPMDRTIDIYVSVDGKFSLSAQADSEGVVQSTVVAGFSIAAAKVFESQ